MGIPLDKAEFLALFLETFVYGVFFLLDVFLLAVIFNSRDKGRSLRMIAFIAIIMLMLATTHLVVDFVRAFHAFVPPAGPISDPSMKIIEYYGNLSDPLFTVKTCLYWAQTLLGDGVIVWRCYVVYNRRILVIVAPILAMVLAFVSGVITINTWAQVQPGTPIFVTATAFVTTYFSVTVFVNVYSTLMIIYKIYTSGSFRDDFRLGMSGMLPVIIVLAESGALYTSGIVAFLCTYLAGSNGQYPALDIVTPLIGIVYCLIILQVRFHTSGSRFFTSTFDTPSHHRARASVSTHISWMNPGANITSTQAERSGDSASVTSNGERLEEIQWRAPSLESDAEIGRSGKLEDDTPIELKSKLGTVWEEG